MKKSTKVALVLLGSIGLGITAGCGTQYRDVYRTREDCIRDNPTRPQECEYDSSYSGGGVVGRGAYLGPARSSRVRSSGTSSRAVTTVTRGGFGSSGGGFFSGRS